MENKSIQTILSNETFKNININKIKNHSHNAKKNYLSNEDYIKLFYNSKNNGINKNFPLNVIYNKRKSKSLK